MKKYLITGGSSGIGKATVNLLKQNKDNYVYFTYNNHKEDALLLEDDNAKAIHLDLGNKESITKCSDLIDELDVLINNAGIALDNDFDDKTYEEFQTIINVNLTGTYYLTKLLSKKINKGGNILFISSTNGIDTTYIESIDYDASKAGIISLMHNFASYLAPDIRVNSVASGWVNTPMIAELSPVMMKEEIEKILLNRICEPIEIAKVIEFITSDDASYINDTVIRIDGGLKK